MGHGIIDVAVEQVQRRCIQNQAHGAGFLRLGSQPGGISACKLCKKQLALGIFQAGCVGEHLSFVQLPQGFPLRHVFLFLIGKGNGVPVGVCIHQIIAPGGIAVEDVRVLHTGNGQNGIKAAGHSHRAGGNRAGLYHIAAPETVAAGKSLVACSNYHVDPRLAGRIINFGNSLHPDGAVCRTQREVDAVRAQKHGVLQSSQNPVHLCAAAGIKYIHRQKLRFRRDPQGSGFIFLL